MWNIETTEPTEQNATMTCNGETVNVDVGVDLKEVVLGTARDAGYGKFRFFINGDEVLPQNAPSITEAGAEYKIQPYDVAGM